MRAQPHLPCDRLAYSIADFSRISGIGKSSVYEMINAGRLTARKIGSRTLILHSDAETFLAGLPDSRRSERT
ncbi:helix-turn-helix domain-containing protein [Methylobacterium isbiliense]|nr:helix-turn-helix domain-containing protein [Methylobacterium isbiliense]MDN3624481.1 helix-turn-helix domain-containing protein [Methylobacterium isbiliense]